ncbi:MAG: hypothetical protein JJE52_06445 [Acidimicrobiia bacterium]|nr:hypothetical protein [Acidimicrobiia bacterium]
MRWLELPDGVEGLWWREGDRSIIDLSITFTRRELRAVLAHHLMPVERGIGYTRLTPDGLVGKEEAAVDRIVAERLVPTEPLPLFVAARLTPHEGATVLHMAVEFDVPLEVAERRSGSRTKRRRPIPPHSVGTWTRS